VLRHIDRDDALRVDMVVLIGGDVPEVVIGKDLGRLSAAVRSEPKAIRVAYTMKSSCSLRGTLPSSAHGKRSRHRAQNLNHPSSRPIDFAQDKLPAQGRKAGTQTQQISDVALRRHYFLRWVPAFAGMTILDLCTTL